MLCSNCKQNEATFHSITTINGAKTETHLCDECRKKLGVEIRPMSMLDDFFDRKSSIFDDDLLDNLLCEHCGTKLSDFFDSGLFGCEHCFDSIGRVILPKIQQYELHFAGDKDGSERKTEIKEQAEAKGDELTELEKLKIRLNEAVKAEDYDLAATLHEQIKAIESKK